MPLGGDVNAIRFLNINQISLDGTVSLLSNHKYITIDIYRDRHVWENATRAGGYDGDRWISTRSYSVTANLRIVMQLPSWVNHQIHCVETEPPWSWTRCKLRPKRKMNIQGVGIASERMDIRSFYEQWFKNIYDQLLILITCYVNKGQAKTIHNKRDGRITS